MDNHIITVSDLKKSYGDVKAVDGISFFVERGKLFSFLGPNGAGKSTTIDILCTLLAPGAGEVSIDGLSLRRDAGDIRRRIGVVFQQNLLDDLLSVRENLWTRARLYGKSKAEIQTAVEQAASATEIGEFLDRPYGKLSGGQRRRADIARALINTPNILFLDEPTTGLDPQTRVNIWQTVRKLQSETGMTVFLTTHYMEEAAESDYVVVIDHGKIAAKGTPAALKEAYATDMLRLMPADSEALRAVLAQNDVDFSEQGREFVVALGATLDAVPLLELCRGYIDGFEVVRGTMDDAFIGITGGALRQ